MECGAVHLLRTIGGIDFTGQARAALNKLTVSMIPLPIGVALRHGLDFVDLQNPQARRPAMRRESRGQGRNGKRQPGNS